MSTRRLYLAILLTLLHGAWLSVIARQHLPLLLFSSHILVFGTGLYLGWSRLPELPSWLQTLIGLAIGYAASVLAAAVVTFRLYGEDQFFDRFFPSSLHAYPFISLGWLYGAMVFSSLFWGGRKSKKN